jgi:membrane protease YdiL (CAAX protease family)
MLKNIFKINKEKVVVKKNDTSSKPSWGPVIAITSTVAIYFLAQSIGALVLTIYGSIHHWNTAYINDWLNNSIYAQFTYSLIAEGFGIAILFAILKHYKSTFKTIGLGRPKIRDIYYVIGGFVAYFIALDVVTTFTKRVYNKLDLNQQQSVGFHSASGAALILVVISLVILPALAEELLFRGFLYTGLKKAIPVIWAGLLTSLLFAVPHLFESASGGLLWVAGLDTFVLSCVLVYLREKTGSLWASIGLHALKNSLAFLALFVFR